MSNRPEVSVVIPTYNRASCIPRTIDSVLAQTYKNYEILIVDDGSTDETRVIVGAYGKRIRYIYQQNAGVSAARNAGILASKGQWVAFLDSDDEWMPTKLEKQRQIADRNSSIVASVTNAGIVLSEQTELDLFDLRHFKFASPEPLMVERPLSLITKLQPFTSSLFVHRNILLSAGLFDETLTLYEDHDLMCRCCLKGPWAIIGETLVKMFRRGNVGIALSIQITREPRLAASNLGKICSKLLMERGLTSGERKRIRVRLSGSRFSEGISVYRQDVKNARRLFWKSFTDNPSLKSMVRSAVGLCLGLKGIQILNRYRSHKGSDLERDQCTIAKRLYGEHDSSSASEGSRC
jgi:glycosyltransferase involved in cell wall biosynthesis